MDEQKSRKLEYIPPRLLDEVFPYVLSLGTQKPTHYTRRGNEVELVAVPDEAKPVYVFYSQWPEELIKDNDEPPFQNLDDVIIQLAEDIARGALEGSRSNYVLRAKELLGTALREDITRPDRTLVARPFQAGELMIGEYWKNPFIKSDP
jgi:hypothetical protein